MSKDVVVIILGFVVMVTPFLGLPSMWKAILLVALGLLIATLAFLLRQDVLDQGFQRRDEVADVYVENGGMHAPEVPKKEAATESESSQQHVSNVGAEVQAAPKGRVRRSRKIHVEENT